jgi:hypothetical protein
LAPCPLTASAQIDVAFFTATSMIWFVVGAEFVVRNPTMNLLKALHED